MTSQTIGQSALDNFAGADAGPAVVRLDGADAVVLTTGAEDVQLWTEHGVTRHAADAAMELVTDPARTKAVLRQAIVALNTLRLQAQAATTHLAEQHAATLAAIRDYAIEAYRDGDICRDGLDDFLHHFELGEYEPYVGLSYTMAGSFTVVSDDEAAVRSIVAQALAPNLAAVRWVRDGSAGYQAMVQALRRVSALDGRSAFAVDFIITGEYEVGRSDTDDAEADCRRNLRPNLTGVPDVIYSSVSFTIEDIDSDLGY